jgi:hypothetical protein
MMDLIDGYPEDLSASSEDRPNEHDHGKHGDTGEGA